MRISDWSLDVCSSDLHLEVEQFRKTRLHALDIPLFGIAALWARIGNDRVDGVAAHVLDDFGDVVRIHDVGALLIDHAALVVHDVVIFDDLLADVVIARLDLLLRGLARLGETFRADRLTILEVRSHYPPEHRFRPAHTPTTDAAA